MTRYKKRSTHSS